MFAAATMLSQRGAHLLRMPPGRKHQRRLQAQVAVVYCQYCQYCSGQHGQHSDYGPWAISLYKILYSAYSLAYRAMECCKKGHVRHILIRCFKCAPANLWKPGKQTWFLELVAVRIAKVQFVSLSPKQFPTNTAQFPLLSSLTWEWRWGFNHAAAVNISCEDLMIIGIPCPLFSNLNVHVRRSSTEFNPFLQIPSCNSIPDIVLRCCHRWWILQDDDSHIYLHWVYTWVYGPGGVFSHESLNRETTFGVHRSCSLEPAHWILTSFSVCQCVFTKVSLPDDVVVSNWLTLTGKGEVCISIANCRLDSH